MLVKYIGPTQTFKAVSLNPQNINDWPEIAVEENQEYDIDIQYEGPQIIINGQQTLHPDGTLWVVFQGQGRIPYSKECIKRQWEVNL